MDESTGGAVNLSPAIIFGNGNSGISLGQVGMEWEDDHGTHHYIQNNMMRVDVDASGNQYSQTQKQQNWQRNIVIDGRSFIVQDQGGLSTEAAAQLNRLHAADMF